MEIFFSNIFLQRLHAKNCFSVAFHALFYIIVDLLRIVDPLNTVSHLLFIVLVVARWPFVLVENFQLKFRRAETNHLKLILEKATKTILHVGAMHFVKIQLPKVVLFNILLTYHGMYVIFLSRTKLISPFFEEICIKKNFVIFVS